MKLSDATRVYGLSRTTFYRMIGKGKLSARKVEGSTMLSIAELDGIFRAE
ncbi:helix-turn-helix domain-containing protein [Pseudodonghicola flavimaris]|uniref:Helix-turn-helix domain-containing protein n=1 Tax=Pseudodonghicola flavimaris TaxID=3050036 RepID=A0ABT7F1L3_9RHOB|nr:helix-turn-helix domain-containing protein [Pseudodonghicola flavimaris]MDK3018477.1 helix-turn-helix domain-containing protein [Pseudodonghicola flavimaris]